MDGPDFDGTMDDVPEPLRDGVKDLHRLIWERAFTNFDMEASIHDDWGTLSADIRNPNHEAHKYFVMGLWAGSTATTQTYIDKNIIADEAR